MMIALFIMGPRAAPVAPVPAPPAASAAGFHAGLAALLTTHATAALIRRSPRMAAGGAAVAALLCCCRTWHARPMAQGWPLPPLVKKAMMAPLLLVCCSNQASQPPGYVPPWRSCSCCRRVHPWVGMRMTTPSMSVMPYSTSPPAHPAAAGSSSCCSSTGSRKMHARCCWVAGGDPVSSSRPQPEYDCLLLPLLLT